MCDCEKMKEMKIYITDAESYIGVLKRKNKNLSEALGMLENMVNESISGIAKPSVSEWSLALSKCHDALEGNKS